MNDIDIEAIRSLLGRKQILHPFRMIVKLLDAYEAESARSEQLLQAELARWSKECVGNPCVALSDRVKAAEARYEAEHARAEQLMGYQHMGAMIQNSWFDRAIEQQDLVIAAERKLQAISDYAKRRHSPLLQIIDDIISGEAKVGY